jgi:benzoylformate decarboxylase
MFTGIITDIGTITSVEARGDLRVTVSTGYDTGSIAIGASVAQPNRPVLCVSGDGSAMYSIQALWSAAHHRLPIVFAILVNREYRVLKHNLDIYRQRFDAMSEKPYPQMDLAGPQLGFVELAGGMGVPGVRVSDPDAVAGAVAAAFAAGGPRLVEIEIEAKR